MSNPIPQKHLAEFIGFMEAHDFDEMSDGAWFATLETAAYQFMKEKKIRGCNNDAAHQYLRKKAKVNG